MTEASEAPRAIAIRWAESGSSWSYWVGAQTFPSVDLAIDFATSDGAEVALFIRDEVADQENLLRQAIAAVTDAQIDLVYFRDLGNIDGYLQPEWSPDLLLHADYFQDAFLVRLSRVQQGAAAHIRDLTLTLIQNVRRVVTITAGKLGGSLINHRVVDEVKDSVQRYCDSNQLDIEVAKDLTGRLHLRRRLSTDPHVSVVIPIRDNNELIRGAPMTLAAIARSVTYPDLEILFSAAPSVNPQAIHEFHAQTCQVYGREMTYRVVQDQHAATFPQLLNLGAQTASSDYLLFTMPMLEFVSPATVRQLIGHSIEPGIGAVAPLVRRSENGIDNAGISTCSGTLVPIQRDLPPDTNGPRTGERSAITSQCLAIARERFELVGGFSEEYESHLFDLDLCFKLRRSGYRVITDLEIDAVSHHESLLASGAADTSTFRRRWSASIGIDDYVRGPLVDQSHSRL